MSRIIGGVVGSLRLKGPAKATRPTSDRVKESIFSILESMDAIQGAIVLDLFAGTGALGLEAASRGASKVTLVEVDESAARVCAQNIERVQKGLNHSGNNCQIDLFQKPVRTFLNLEMRASLVFMDPPYSMGLRELLGYLPKIKQQVKPELIVFERSDQFEAFNLNSVFKLNRRLSFGATEVLFLS